MITIDLRTVYLNFILTSFVSLIFVVLLWYQNRKRYVGLHLLVVDFLLQLICITLIFFRGMIPDFMSIVFSNLLGMMAAWAGLTGLEKFVGRKSNYLFNVLFVLFFLSVQIYFTHFDSNLSFRNLNISVGYLFFGAQSAWLLLYRTPKKLRSFTLYTGLAFVFFCAVNFTRVLVFIALDGVAEQDYFRLGGFESIIPLSYQIVLLLLSFFIVLMINKRLINDITVEEQKLSIAYHEVPYAILITNKDDGRIIDVNQGFELISGYFRTEVIGKSSIELELWRQNFERDLLMAELGKNDVVKDMEFLFRKKSGEFVVGQVSCINVTVDDQDCVLSVINDITEKKRAEKELEKSRDILKNLLVNLHTEHEKEKVNIAAQIDLSLNQSLAALRMNIGMIKEGLRVEGNVVPDKLMALVDSSYNQVGTTIERTLGLMHSMRNEVLYLLGFVEAVNYSVEEIVKNSNVICNFQCVPDKIDLNQNKSTLLFNVFQEIINLILRKNQVRNIEIVLDKRDDILVLVIVEDGNSFADYYNDNNAVSSLYVLKEKLALFSAVLSIVREEDMVTTISIEMSEN